MKKCPRCGKEYEDANTLCPADGTVLQKDDELVGQTLIGKYRIDERISEGGMGAVYKATHVLMEKTLAIKVLHPALAADDKIVARFTREAKAASRISHPHALTVTDFGESEGGVVFLVMEYIRGRTLKDVIRSEGPMPFERATEIVRQVAGALDAAHGEGVVHRDLKSDNIMLEQTAGGGDWAKVLDFGIAKIKEKVGVQDQGLTAPNLIIGTPQYMSPEQCSQASNIDARSDIYSLGVILFEMLAGHVPFSGDSPTETMMKHLQEPVPSLLDHRNDVPAAVDLIIKRAMSKRPEDRFQTAGEFSEALQLADSGDPAAIAAAAAAASKSSMTDGQGAYATNRIVVSTGENEPPRSTGSEDVDEATVVRARAEQTGEQYTPLPAPLPASTFNPWRIAIPAIAVLAVVFGLFYIFQGKDQVEGDGGSETQNRPVTTSPGGRPVQSASPPTGESERDIAPTSDANTAQTEENVSASPQPAEEEEEGDAEEEPPPPRANRNDNRRAPVPPPPATNVDVQPPSAPSPATSDSSASDNPKL